MKKSNLFSNDDNFRRYSLKSVRKREEDKNRPLTSIIIL